MFLKALEEYIKKFPEVESKRKIFQNATMSDEEKLEQFLIYTYWFFDEYHSQEMEWFARTASVTNEYTGENEESIGRIWIDVLFQIDFYYKYQSCTEKIKDKTYEEFSAYSSNRKNHKIKFYD